MKKACRRFSVTEMIVVVGIIALLAVVIFPIASNMRAKAKKELCRSNLMQIHSALTMYALDHNRLTEVYPMYLTHLFSGGEGTGLGGGTGAYISDARVFVCPMDSSNAGKNKWGVDALKPIYQAAPNYATTNYGTSKPTDDKREWSERSCKGAGMGNSSYLYEFSGRICQSFFPDDYGGFWVSDSPNNFGEYYLISSEDHYMTPTPFEIVRDGIPQADGSIAITWQDMKFHQLSDGDIYIAGIGWAPDDFPEPPAGFEDPSDWYWNNNIDYENYVTSYPRSWMPIVRCFYHQSLAHIDSEGYEEVLNLAIGGNTFNSSPFWERTAFKYGSRVGVSTY